MEPVDVYSLIDRLSSAERRYFSLKNKKGDPASEHQYYRFYEFILRENIGSDEQLKAHPEGGQYHLGKNLSSEKRRLLEQILASIADFDAAARPSFQRRYALMRAESLEARGFVRLALEELAGLKKKAEQAEAWNFLIEVNALEARLAATQQSRADFASIGELHRERAKILHFLSLDIQLKTIWEELLAVVSGRVAQPGSLQPFAESLERFEAEPELKRSHWLYIHMNHALLELLRGQPDLAHQAYQSVVSEIEQMPWLERENPRMVLLHLYNYLNLSHAKGVYDDFERYLPKIKDLENETARKGNQNPPYHRFLQTIHLANTMQLEQALEVAIQLEKQYQEPLAGVPPSNFMAATFNIFMLQFLCGKAKDAKETLERLLDTHRGIHLRKELRRALALFEIIIHHELGHETVVESKCRSVRRQATRDTPAYELVQRMTSLFASLLQNDPNSNGHFSKAEVALTALRDSHPGLSLEGLNECLTWVGAKARALPILDYIKTLPNFKFSPQSANAFIDTDIEPGD